MDVKLAVNGEINIYTQGWKIIECLLYKWCLESIRIRIFLRIKSIWIIDFQQKIIWNEVKIYNKRSWFDLYLDYFKWKSRKYICGLRRERGK